MGYTVIYKSFGSYYLKEVTNRKIYKERILVSIKMKGLVIVHTENCYLPSSNSSKFVISADELGKRFDQIALEIPKYLTRGEPVVYLEGEKNARSKGKIYPSISNVLDDVVVVPMTSFNGQFLKSKEVVMNLGVDQPEIVGVAYACCVKSIYNLFTNRLIDPYDKLCYETESWTLLWAIDKFKKVMAHNIDARIREELTDKF